MNQHHIWQVVSRAALWPVAVVSVIGCNADRDLLRPRFTHSSAVNVTGNGAQPFYYYQGQQIPLNLDPTRLVVGSTPTAASTARHVLQDSLGIAVDSVSTLAGSPNHSIVYLSAATSIAIVSEARQRLLRNPGIRFVRNTYKTADDGSDVVLLNRVIVHFVSGAAPQSIDALIRSLGLTVERTPSPDSGFGEYWLTYPSDSTADALHIAAQLYTNPIVQWADPDKISNRHPQLVPNDPYIANQYYIANPTTFGGIHVDDNIESAWNLTTGSSGITVAILDEGVDFTNPDVGPALVAGFDTYSVPGEDAIHPCLTCTGGGVTGDAHGTAVAGIVAARQNNAVGISGVAPGVKLVSVRVLRNNVANSDGQVANGINWASSASGGHADVLSNSWGGGSPSDAITNAIVGASSQGRGGKGATIVFAGGNSADNDHGIAHSLIYPASLSSGTFTASRVVSVGAIDRSGGLADYSNTGAGLTLVAPSSHLAGDLTTTDLTGIPGYNGGPNGDLNYTSLFGGTSAAAPQVAAVAALLLSREPGLTEPEVKTRLAAGADPWGSVTNFGAGKLDALATLLGVSALLNGPTSVTPPCNGFPTCTGQKYTWTSTPSGGNGTFTYQWRWRPCGQGTANLGTASSQALTLLPTSASFYLQLIVTSGGRNTTVTIFVNNTTYTPPPGIQCFQP